MHPDSAPSTAVDPSTSPQGLRGVMRTVRYARSWKTRPRVQSQQVQVLRDGQPVEATLVTPARSSGRLPAWIAVGGVSLKGRFHPQLKRFTEALASSGAMVLVPEIPEWTELRVSPRLTLPTIRGAVDYLNGRDDIIPGSYGVIGFSFGAPGVAIAASQDDIADQMAGIVLFGGYCSLDRTLDCQLTGRHDWDGIDYSLAPDPYGRWVVASNYLTHVPGLEDASDVADALRTLAAAASGQRISAWEPHHDQMIAELRQGLPASRQSLFDHFASTSRCRRPEECESRELAGRLAEACRRIEPLLDPVVKLGDIGVPTQVIHGHGDRLVPFTEGLRLMDELPESVRRGVTVTRMLNHSADNAPESAIEGMLERTKLFAALRRLILTV